MNSLCPFPGVIFLVEHQKECILELDRLFRSAKIKMPVKIARFGNEAIQYLKGSGIYHDRLSFPLPSIIIIDITNPDGSSMALIGWIREQKTLLNTPIIILADSEQSPHMQKALNLGANAYLLKKENLAEVVRVINSLEFVAPSVPALLKPFSNT